MHLATEVGNSHESPLIPAAASSRSGTSAPGSHRSDRSTDSRRNADGSRRGPAGSTPSSNGKKTFFEKTRPGRSGGTSAQGPNVSLMQIIGLNWIRVNLISSLKTSAQDDATDLDPIIISTLPGHCLHDSPATDQIPRGSAGVNVATRRPNLPEGLTNEELDADNQPLNLPEAVRRGLRNVQNLPVHKPYGKLLNAQFMLSFRQVAGLTLDDEFRNICKMLLELSLKREARNDTVATTRAAVEIICKLQLAFSELPFARMSLDRVPVSSSEENIDAQACSLAPTSKLSLSLVHMAGMRACLDDTLKVNRLLKMDSGAAVSCISQDALRRDLKYLVPPGRATLHKLLTPMTLIGFASGHTKVTQALEGVQLIIGQAKCTHNFLVVPGLVCDYLIGQDFMEAYDMRLNLVDKMATMGVTQTEWLGSEASYVCYQDVNIVFVSDEVHLDVCSP